MVYGTVQVWACLRTLDSFGIQHAHIVSDPSTYSKKARLKTMCTAMGSQKWLSLHGHDTPEDAVAKLKADGYQVNEPTLCVKPTEFLIVPAQHAPGFGLSTNPWMQSKYGRRAPCHAATVRNLCLLFVVQYHLGLP